MRERILGASLLIALISPLADAADDNPAALASETPTITISLPIVKVPEARPAILPALYVSLAGLQAFDIYSTRAGLARGAAEVNPLVAPVAGDTTGMIVLKTVSTGTTIMLTEHLWHRNRTAAILTMVAANSVMALIAANNARVLHQVR
jgi:hypothetical protein